jgi:hypothetical protein
MADQDEHSIREQERMQREANLLRADQERRRIEAQEQSLRDLERQNLSEEEMQRQREVIRSQLEETRLRALQISQEVSFCFKLFHFYFSTLFVIALIV